MNEFIVEDEDMEDVQDEFDEEDDDVLAAEKLTKVTKVKEAKAEKGGKEKVIKDPSTKKKPKKAKKGKELKFDTFIHRVLKQISEEAGKLVKMDHRDTLSARDINCAVRLILPGELAQHSNDEGQSALKLFEHSSAARKAENRELLG